MRLIDADKLNFEGQKYNKSQMKAILDFIDAQPTIYDIDKVVEELHEERTEILLSNDYENEIINYCLDNFDRAIEIVENGLKEQNK